jgi:hypothetical protein
MWFFLLSDTISNKCNTLSGFEPCRNPLIAVFKGQQKKGGLLESSPPG